MRQRKPIIRKLRQKSQWIALCPHWSLTPKELISIDVATAWCTYQNYYDSLVSKYGVTDPNLVECCTHDERMTAFILYDDYQKLRRQYYSTPN